MSWRAVLVFGLTPAPGMLTSLLNAYPWFEHPEGIKFVEVERNALRSIGHWLFLPGTFSAFHRVSHGDEIWAIHAGRLRLHVLTAAGEWTQIQLGVAADRGERPVAAVPAGCWQAAECPADEPYAFGSNVCAPPFAYAQFELARRDDLCRAFPAHAELITRLTRG